MLTDVQVQAHADRIRGDGFTVIEAAASPQLVEGLIAGKTIDLEWATVRALILLRVGPNRTAAPADIERARVNYLRLMPSTAQRVVAFWKTR